MNIHIVQETGLEDDFSGNNPSETDESGIPGLTQPLRYIPRRASGPKTALGDRFENPFLFVGHRVTAREIAMIGFMNQITDKPAWERKVFDDTVTQRWREEVKATGKLMDSDATVDYCIAELQEKAKHFEKTRLVAALNTDCSVIKSDAVVPEDLRISLINACRQLQNRPEAERDWHPKSNNQVLNLAHPSLFPLVYGHTRVLKDPVINTGNCLSWCGRGSTIPAEVFVERPSSTMLWRRPGTNTLHTKSHWWSPKFQWLPSEVAVDANGNPSIQSYINNLNPETHLDLYGVIEQVVKQALPAWGEALKVTDSEPRRISFLGPATWNRVPDSELPAEQKPEWYDWDNKSYQADSEAEDEYTENYEPDLHRIYIHPEPTAPAQFSAELSRISSTGWLKKHLAENPQLQIIVKLAGIELTPDSPTYPGGNWHLEGQLNEHIVATALYYYDCDNVTESGLEFRQTAHVPDMNLIYEQDDYGGLEEIFGTDFRGITPALQDLGIIKTCQGRLLAFPNTLQHRVTQFELADATKPGHRRFIALWLVDPTIRVISTAYVPPQDLDWSPEFKEQTESIIAAATTLPMELQQMISRRYQPNMMHRAEALQYRLELLDERSQNMFPQTRDFEHSAGTYVLCEH